MGPGDFVVLVGLGQLGLSLFLRFSSSPTARTMFAQPAIAWMRPFFVLFAFAAILVGLGWRDDSTLPMPAFVGENSIWFFVAAGACVLYAFALPAGAPYPRSVLPSWLREQVAERDRQTWVKPGPNDQA